MTDLRHLRAPPEDGAVLAAPPLTETGTLLAENRRRLGAGPSILGLPWAELRRRAREEVVEAARAYHRGAGEPVPDHVGDALLVAGHQPELFHPGVWVKNFALNGLARQHGLRPLNLVVDNDTAKTAALRLPALATGGATRTHLTSIPFDHWNGETPYEELPVRDEGLFATFAERTRAVTDTWGFRPLLGEFWEEVRRQGERTPLLGERLAAARRSLERRWGCANLEVPVSAVCRTAAFAWFACHLLSGLPRFHAVYNASVQDHRRRHGLRSRNHPAPDLVAEGDWLETPFWGWRTGQARRGRLMARLVPEGVALRVGEEVWPLLPLPGDRPEQGVEAWRERERQGFKVRSRALTNTLFARLLLGDAFLHGLGGGKYDEVTDAIARRFYGVEPPGYLVLSATQRLPLKQNPARPEEQRRLARLIRDLHYNPERHRPAEALGDRPFAELVARKKRWIARAPADTPTKRERFQALRAVSASLRPLVQAQVDLAEKDLADCQRQLEANAVLRRRDFAFCLFPEETLRPFCARFLK